MIRVLIVDDSRLTRVVLRDLLAKDPGIQVVAEVGDGRVAVEQVALLRPDLVIMDVMMPVMDGLDAISEIMAQTPTPILVLSANTDPKDSRNAFAAIRLGALDVMAKPEGVVTEAFDEIAGQLIAKVKSLSRIRVLHHFRKRPPAQAATAIKVWPKPSHKRRILAIGASTGGPQAILSLLRDLPPGFPAAVLIVQHIAEGFAPGFADWLNRETQQSVHLARQGAPLTPGQVLVAPNGFHFTIAKQAVLLTETAPQNNCRPAIDALFSSLATDGLATETVAVLLTGMGQDGAAGMVQLHQQGACTLAQDEATSAIFGMPKAAIERNAIDQVLSLENLAGFIRRKFEI